MTGHPLDLSLKADGATLKAWEALARKTLGDRAKDALGTRADWPLADASGFPGAAPVVRGTQKAHARWDIRTIISDPDPSCANAQALEDIAGGATSLWFRLQHASRLDDDARLANGIRLSSADDEEVLLKDIPTDKVALALDAGFVAGSFAEELVKHIPSDAALFANLDVFAAAERYGVHNVNLTEEVRRGIAVAKILTDRSPNVRTFGIDGSAYHNAGATPSTEIAAALASGVAYLRALEAAGLSIAQAARQIAFILVTDADVVRSIAKLRAFRRCWARVLDACGAGDAMREVHITAVIVRAHDDAA